MDIIFVVAIIKIIEKQHHLYFFLFVRLYYIYYPNYKCIILYKYLNIQMSILEHYTHAKTASLPLEHAQEFYLKRRPLLLNCLQRSNQRYTNSSRTHFWMRKLNACTSNRTKSVCVCFKGVINKSIYPKLLCCCRLNCMQSCQRTESLVCLLANM